ncbi:MAG: M14 family zinc carboxypeptidase [Candidatus Aminicenantales bacterium]
MLEIFQDNYYHPETAGLRFYDMQVKIRLKKPWPLRKKSGPANPILLGHFILFITLAWLLQTLHFQLAQSQELDPASASNWSPGLELIASETIKSWPASFLLRERKERFLVRVRGTEEKLQELASKPLDFARPPGREFLDIIVTEDELQSLIASGYKVNIIQREREAVAQAFDPMYHTYEQTIAILKQAEIVYPEIAKIFIIGESTRFGLPIYALKISDNVQEDEDEFAFLIDGMHHAREPLGNEICLAFVNYLLINYQREPRVTRWVDENEIWVIPILNPEGYKYIVDNNLASPWWRKNLRDNNGNGQIDPDYDGVDLNRNYDYNWHFGGSTNPDSWTYRGPFPFSEKETQAKRDLATKKKFVVAVSYHSYGEEVMYPWSWPNSGARAPDHDLIYELASEMAKRIKNEAGTGNYALARLSGANQSPVWMYGAVGTLEFLIETGTSFIPPGYRIKPIVEANLEGLFYLLDRLTGPGIKGKVLDLITRKPLEAEVWVLEVDNFQYIIPRSTRTDTGRFVRLLRPGKYTLLVTAKDYFFRSLSITVDKEMISKDVGLRKEEPRGEKSNIYR